MNVSVLYRVPTHVLVLVSFQIQQDFYYFIGRFTNTCILVISLIARVLPLLRGSLTRPVTRGEGIDTDTATEELFRKFQVNERMKREREREQYAIHVHGCIFIQ